MMRKKNATTQNCSNCSGDCGKCGHCGGGKSKTATKSNQVETARSAGKRTQRASSTRAKTTSTRSKSSK